MFEGVQVIAPDWRYIYLNRAAAEHARRPREDLVGRKMTEAFPGIDQTEMFGLLRGCMTERHPQHMLNRFTYPDGHSAWFDLRMNPVPMGVLVLSVDVSEQKAMEEELRRSREDLATTLECMADGLITTDVEGRVVRMNPAAEALTGWSEEDASGRLLDDLVRFLNQKTQEAVEQPVETVLREGLKLGLVNDTVLVTRDGRRIPVATSGAPIRDGGGAIRGVVIVVKNMKEEYQLAAMLQQAQKMEAVGRLAGGVAHDFNNLLTVISGYSDLVLAGMSPEDQFREELEEIRHAGDRAAALTRQLLAFSRRQVLKPEVLDDIWVYSEVGRGTTFKVYLSRAQGTAAAAEAQGPVAVRARAGETILVVEDEPAVRALIRSVLEKGGYTVLAAAGADEAGESCRRHEGDIHLLLTDVVLPGTGGREVAARIRSLRPGIRTVFMSGYTDDAIVHHQGLEPGTPFIEKPITAHTLLAKVREFLA